MTIPADRFASLNAQDAEFKRRWVFPVDVEAEQLLDKFNELVRLQGLSTRARNCLTRAGVPIDAKWLLYNISKLKLARIRGVCRKTLREITRWMDAYDESWNDWDQRLMQAAEQADG